jgi:hypothetical protein
MAAISLLVLFAERRFAERLGQHVRDGRFTEHAFDARGGGVESAVQRAEVQRVIRIADRAFGDASRRFDDRYDRQQRQGVRRDRQREPAVEPALRRDDPAAPQDLQDLCQVARGDAGAVGNLLGGERGAARLCRQA